jgi:polysaccharide export outer membrane protein
MRYLAYFFFFFLIFSCESEKKISYFQGDFPKENIQLSQNFDPVIKINDLLEIKLIATNDEAVKLLAPEVPNARSTVTYNSGGVAKGGFLVDPKGNIELPFIGEILAAGKTRSQVIEDIESKLSEYIKDPIVQLQIINFKVVILGDVKFPGTVNVPNERMTILEALGITGDLNITGKRTDIKLIREVGDSLVEYKVDLTNKMLFAQPYYYLVQNDIIYVTQNKAKMTSAGFSQIYFPILSAISLTIGILNIFTK